MSVENMKRESQEYLEELLKDYNEWLDYVGECNVVFELRSDYNDALRKYISMYKTQDEFKFLE